MARRVRLGGMSIRDVSTRALVRFLDRRPTGRQICVGFVNFHFIVACRPLKREPADPNGLILVNDGAAIHLSALLTTGRGFRENMIGTDFVPRFLARTRHRLRVYLLGDTPAVARRAAAAIEATTRHDVVGTSDGYSLWGREDDVVAAINALAPDVLLVALGNPKQERFILQHRHRLEVPMIFAVGALFTVLAGAQPRAPALVRRARMEWLFRLVNEPRRLLRRYTLEVAEYLWILMRDRA